MKTFREIVREALEAVLVDPRGAEGVILDRSDDVALAIDRELKRQGIGLHELARCEWARELPAADRYGREMTPAELAMVRPLPARMRR